MDTKLTRHGEHWALLIEPEVLSQLGINEDTPLQVETDGDALVVRPRREQHRDEPMLRIHAELMEGYENVFRRLAE